VRLLGRRLAKIAFALRSVAQVRALTRGLVCEPSHVRLLRELSPGVIIDVGANRGQFVLAGMIACPEARVLAFEPLEQPYGQLVNFFQTKNVTVRRMALGRIRGSARLYETRDSDSSSLLRPTDEQCSLFPGALTRQQTEIHVSTLDIELDAGKWFGSESILKVDVQGFELEVLLGAERSLRSVSWVLVEVSFAQLYHDQCTPDDLLNFLRDQGFRLVRVVDFLRAAGAVVQADLLFERVPSD
jgi:FkbM family methyltransferase